MQFARKRVVALITGATGTFGSRIAHAITKVALTQDAESLTLILHARPTSIAALEALSVSLRRTTGPNHHSLATVLFPFDLRSCGAGKVAEQLLSRHSKGVQTAVLFNNAGVLRAASMSHLEYALDESFAVNVSASAGVAAAFVNAVPSTAWRGVVLITSLAALQSFRTWGAYCSSKIAAEMAHRVLAHEHPDLRVLCYAPGPMQSRMTASIETDTKVDPALRTLYKRMREERKFVCPQKSAEKMIDLLITDEYSSGKHIDFYDS